MNYQIIGLILVYLGIIPLVSMWYAYTNTKEDLDYTSALLVGLVWPLVILVTAVCLSISILVDTVNGLKK